MKEPVLVTSAGTVVAQGIMKSLKLANSEADTPRYKVIATDMSPKAAGLYRSDVGIIVPPADSADYLDAMVKLCREENVRAIFVGSEEELSPLSENAQRIERETGTVVLTDARAVAIGRDKWKTFEHMRKAGLPCAASALPADRESLVAEFGFPVVVKPREGHGSLEFHLAHDREEVDESVAAVERAGWRAMLQQYLPEYDEEFTSGVTVDKEGKTVMSSISMKRTLKNGQTYKAFIDDYPEVRTAAEQTALNLGLRGPVNLQARMSGGEPKAFEMNPRFSASCAMRATAGVNEPDIVFRNWVLDEPVRVDSYKRLVCLRYLNELYVPLSDYEAMVRGGRTAGGVAFVPDYF